MFNNRELLTKIILTVVKRLNVMNLKDSKFSLAGVAQWIECQPAN